MADPPDWIAEFTMSPRQFAEHLDAIADSGRTPITAARLIEGGPGLPARPVLITFDDGFADLPGPTAEAVAGRGMTATAYLTTGAIGAAPGGSLLPPAPMMKLGEAARLEDDYGFEVGSHTVTHAQLDTLPAAAIRHELTESKSVLEDALGHGLDALAYPHGYNDRRVRRIAEAAGYTSAMAVRHALSHSTDEPYRLARLIVRQSHTAADVRDWMAGEGARQAPYRDGAKTVGWRYYRRARRMVKGPEFAG
ncbi:polysaccharide deacetylase family protein [Streptomyces boninensis]|uniref:polysaccharide deacetylase family protein n=1 Tax=Streptomyces boninensis TaxID=2039455 RepID=UPI003B21F4E0